MRERARRLAALLALAPLALSAAPAAAAETVTVTYRLSYGDLDVGVVTDRVALGDGSYRIESRAVAEGLAALLFAGDFVRVSEGEISPAGGLRPLRYSQSRGDDVRAAEFDWEAGRLALSWPSGEGEEPIAAGAAFHDRLSFLYQPLATCRAPGGTYHVTDGKRLSTYEYRVTSEEPSEFALGGETRAIRLDRVGDGKASVLRLAPEHGMVPVSFHTGNGSVYRFRLVAAEGIDPGRCG